MRYSWFLCMVVHKTSTAVVTHYTLLSHTISLAVGGSVALIAHTRPLHTIYIIGFSPNDFLCWFVLIRSQLLHCTSVVFFRAELWLWSVLIFLLRVYPPRECCGLSQFVSQRNCLFGCFLIFSGILILFKTVYCTHADPYNHSEDCGINVYYIHIFIDKEFLDAGYESFDF